MLSPISYALQHGILLRGENPTYTYSAPVTAAGRGFKMVSFTVSRGNTFVGGTCALPSALLVDPFSKTTGVSWHQHAQKREPNISPSSSYNSSPALTTLTSSLALRSDTVENPGEQLEKNIENTSTRTDSSFIVA